MKHIALYRKWRPQRFQEVIGQEHISRTLLNALRQDRMAHAYLFCGPRGTGKTTSARLLAKALNCTQPQDGEPCNTCQNCQEITNGQSLDVIEIDAASNRGIDDARELREQVRFAATGSRYRVFIIDEFHMLTSEAFNALLKTLEEPPDNVIFVLATTEPHKILQTILSRCQRFDFQRIGLNALIAHLTEVAKAEKIGISAQALEAIARKASGGLRDALSLLDQVHALAQADERLPDDLVYQTLGLIQEDVLFQLVEGVFLNQVSPILETTQYLLGKGYDAALIIQETVQLLRHLLLAHLPPEHMEALSVPHHLIERLKTLYTQLSEGQIVGLLEHLIQVSDRLRQVVQPDIWLEAELMRYALLRENTLLERLEQLEAKLAAGNIPTAPHQAIPAPPAPKPIPPSDPRPQSRPERREPEPDHPPLPTPIPEAEPLQPASALPPTEAMPPLPEPDLEPPVSEETFEPTAENEPTIPPPAPTGGPPSSPDPGHFKTQWQRLLKAFEVDFRPDIGFISNGRLVHIDAARKTWVIRFASRPHKMRIEKQLRAGTYNAVIEAVAGPGFRFILELEGENNARPQAQAASPSSPASQPQTAPPPKQTESPLAAAPPATPSHQPAPLKQTAAPSTQPVSQAPSVEDLRAEMAASIEPPPTLPDEPEPEEAPNTTPHVDAEPSPSPEPAAPPIAEVRWVDTEPVQVVAELFKGKVIPVKSP